MSAKEATKEVAVKPEASTLPAVMGAMFETDVGAGFEQADKDAYAIPFLAILQSGSPQCKRSDGAYVPGAEEGKLFNTVTSEIFDGAEGVLVVPCYYRRSMVEWKSRNDEGGRGFVAEHEVSVALTMGAKRDANNRDILPNGNLLADTRYHYVLLLDNTGGYRPALITMTSTQLKKSRKWMTIMDGIKLKRTADGALYTPPMFSHSYRLSTVPEKNDFGSWFGYHVEVAGPVVDASIYTAAKSFRDAIRKGDVKAATPTEREPGSDDVGF